MADRRYPTRAEWCDLLGRTIFAGIEIRATAYPLLSANDAL
ncbi:MAG: hypothetical protein ACU0B9_07510 [Limimaricola soesokkakensis]